MIETQFASWLHALPAAGWRGTVAELAAVLTCSARKLSEFLAGVRPVFRGARIEFEMFECRRGIRITRIVERPFQPWEQHDVRDPRGRRPLSEVRDPRHERGEDVAGGWRDSPDPAVPRLRTPVPDHRKGIFGYRYPQSSQDRR